MGYYVKYKELQAAQALIINQINQWYQELEHIKQQVQAIAKMQEMKGDTANSIKNYMQDIHLPVILSMQNLLKEYMSKMLLYCNEYYKLDTKQNALMLQDRLDDQITVIQTRTGVFQEIEGKVAEGVGIASGLAPVTMPSGDKITRSYDKLSRNTAKLMNEIGECEYGHLRTDFRNIDDVLSELQEFIYSHIQKGTVTITSYQAGSIKKVPALKKLKEASANQRVELEEVKKESLNYKELNAIYWNRTDEYFNENWTDNEEKLEEALNIIKLEAIEQGGIDLISQVTQLGYGKDNYRLQTLIKLSQISQGSMGKDIAITEAEKEVDWKDKALAYLKDSGEQILKGNYTDKVTLGGTVGEILLGVVGVDLPMDIRDLVYDVTHFEWNWKCVGMLVIDVVALVPVIGAIKYSDEVVKLTKRWTKNLDGKVEIAADAVAGFGKKLKGLIDSGVKKVSSAANSILTDIKAAEGTKKAKEILEGLRKKIFKGGSKTLKHIATSGVELTSTPGKTTTVLGRFGSDTGDIIKELKIPKNTDFSGNPGGFNLLNTPDELYSKLGAEGFWNEYNKPFLDAAIERGDEILMSTPITNSNLYLRGTTELTGYGREYYYMIDHGYTYVDGKMILK